MVELAQSQLKDYRQRWLPVQRNLADGVVRMGADGSFQRDQAQGIATTDTEAQFSRGRQKAEAGMAGGMGSSKAKLAITGMGEDQATSAGMGRTQAEQQIDDAYAQGLGSIMAIGQGQKADAITGMGQVADMSGRRAANDAFASLESRANNARTGAQIVGMGYGAAGGWKPKPGGVSGTNDLAGVNGQSAMDTWLRSGVGGD